MGARNVCKVKMSIVNFVTSGQTTTAYIDLFHYVSTLLKAHSIYNRTEN